MPFLHGRLTQILLDSKDISAWLRSFDFNADVDLADVTTFSKAWKVYQPGLIGASLEAGGIHDVSMQDIRAALTAAVQADSIVTMTPGAVPVFGDPARLMASIHASYKESMPVGDIVAFAWSARADDFANGGNNMHPLAAETVTGTSTFLDGGAQTLTGAIAHLHITAISGAAATLTVKFSDATTSGGVYTDIAGGSFAAKTAVGGTRLVIPGTIRQFVKATWTISGTTPSITFAVAFSRT